MIFFFHVAGAGVEKVKYIWPVALQVMMDASRSVPRRPQALGAINARPTGISASGSGQKQFTMEFTSFD